MGWFWLSRYSQSQHLILDVSLGWFLQKYRLGKQQSQREASGHELPYKDASHGTSNSWSSVELRKSGACKPLSCVRCLLGWLWPCLVSLTLCMGLQACREQAPVHLMGLPLLQRRRILKSMSRCFLAINLIREVCYVLTLSTEYKSHVNRSPVLLIAATQRSMKLYVCKWKLNVDSRNNLR